jgi:hypothetical protein
MSLTETYGDVLSPFVKQYQQAANEKGRRMVVAHAVDAVKKARLFLEDAADLPQDLPTVCHSFFIAL